VCVREREREREKGEREGGREGERERERERTKERGYRQGQGFDVRGELSEGDNTLLCDAVARFKAQVFVYLL